MNANIQGVYSSFRSEDFLQSSLSKTLLQREGRVPKTDIWKTMFTWLVSKREDLVRVNHHYENLILGITNSTPKNIDLHRITELRQETRAMEMILHWVMHDGKKAFKRAEYVLEKRRVKHTNIEQDIKQLLELMEQEYWRTHPTSRAPLRGVSVFSCKEIFRTMLDEIPKLIVMHQRLGLRYFTLEDQLSNSFDKILRLSSWTPSSAHNKHLHELLRNALQMLNDLGGNEEYHDDLRDFMKRHTTFCAFTLDNAYAITAEDSETTTELCKNLRRLAQNLGKIASTKAEQYQKLYEKFIANKEELSHWLDSASPGQGKVYFWFLSTAFYI